MHIHKICANPLNPRYQRAKCLNHDFHRMDKIYRINPANPENLDKITVQTKAGGLFILPTKSVILQFDKNDLYKIIS